MKFSRLAQGLISGLALLAAVGTAHAQTYPSRYITMVVPYAAGGPTDINARLLVPALSEALGQRVVVENRGGAGTTLGTSMVSHAAPDGYTLLFADLGLAVSHNIVRANYNAEKDFAPVAFVSASSLVLVVNPNLPVKTFAELIELAKKKPDQLQYASAGLGTPPHLAGLALTKATGAQMTHIAYKGSGLAVGDVVSGQVPLMFLGPSASASYVKTGKLRAIAITGKQRSPALPDVPTFRELGIDLGGIDAGTWWGIVAPAGTPPDVIAMLNKAANASLADPTVKENFAKFYLNAVGGTPEEFGAFLKSQQTYWADLLKGVSLEEK